MVPFLSHDWFESVAQALEPTKGLSEERPDLTCRVQFDATSSAGHVRWTQAVSAGMVTEWRLGECSDPDVEIQLSLGHAWELWRGGVNGNDALAALTVAEMRPTGRWAGSPAPMDLGQQPELGQLEHFPGLTLDVQYEYQRGPFGPVDFALSFIDGQVDRMSLSRMPEPDVFVRSTFLQMALVRRGDITILDALMRGTTVEGAEGALALLAGISESPGFRAAERACGRSGWVLGVLGEVTSDWAHREAMGPVAAVTGPPHGL